MRLWSFSSPEGTPTVAREFIPWRSGAANLSQALKCLATTGVLRTVGRAILISLTLGASAQAQALDPPTISLELLSEHNLPGGFRFDGTCVGGLSALYYDRANRRYFAISDSRRDARFYTLRLEIAEDGGGARIARVEFESVVRLATREGLPYPDDRVDPEGFALFDASSAFISSEGVADEGVPPFVDRVDVATGEWLATLPIPLAFRPRHEGETKVQGVRNNLGLESLTLSPDRRRLYTATESALAQDAADITAGVEHFARLLHFELEPAPRLAAESLYPLTMPEGNVVVHGLVEILSLDDADHLLALERTWGPEIGMRLGLFEVRLGEHRDADRSRLSPAARALPVLAKRQLLDFNQLPILLDNLEGITLGPRLADGSETLVFVGDNDNTECVAPISLAQLRPTKLLLFRLRR